MMTIVTVLLILLSGTGCSECGEGCSTCLGLVQRCASCKNEYWLHNYNCQRCQSNCEQCNDISYCSKCNTHFWGNGTCDKQCPESCDKTGCEDETGHCYGCQPGFYSTSCRENCTLCKDELCNIHDGQCYNGCIDGYYQDTLDTFKKCRKCLENCKKCESLGFCSECEKGFYKERYKTSLNNTVSVCYACFPFCEECNTFYNCTSCKSGTFGPLCQYNCSLPYCDKCSEADSGEKCTECTTGYKVDDNTCVPEMTCSQNCVNGCDKNEKCEGGCKDGWSGQKCTTQCASQCQKCQIDNGEECTMCKGDLYSFPCSISCDVHCFRIPFVPTCRLQDGFCLNDCTDGYWGDTCNNSCSIGCNTTQCSRTEGYCETCRRKYYGAACKHTCSEHCLDDGSTPQVCRKTDGRCEHGCNSGYSGNSCEYQTSSSLTTVPTAERTDSHFSHPDTTGLETKSLVLGIVIGVGISLIIAAVTGLFCFLRRRRRLNTDINTTFENAEQSDYENTMIGMIGMPSAGKDCYSENQRSDLTHLEASPNMYERLQDKYDDQQQYTELGGQKG